MKFGNNFRTGIAVFLLMGGLCSCSCPRNVFLLLPEENGTVGRIVVGNEGGDQLLQEAWSGTRVADAGKAPAPPKPVSQEEASSLFGSALAAQPKPVARFILYFTTESTFTSESQELLSDVLKAIAERESTDISVIGHTDRLGEAEMNYELSRQRAETVAGLLVDRGVHREILEIGSHGEGNPIIPTPDETPEPRNRRVEITVR